MSERPLNERPAAKPAPKAIKPEVPASDETPVEYVKVPPFWSSLGCGGWAILILLVLGLLSYVGSAITTAITDSQKSSGQETYNVTPDTVDPRSTYTISAKCEAAMAASAADPSENGERLLKETGNICGSKAEWEAALYKYPEAIGMTDGSYLDGSEFNLLCGSYPEVKICKANN